MRAPHTFSTLKSYIKEVKSRTVYTFLSLIFTFFIAYYKATQLTYVFLLSFSLGKYKEKNFIFTDLSEAFSSTISICLVMSFFCVLPLGVYQFLSFLSPSWYVFEREKYCKRVFAIFPLWMYYIYLIQSSLIPKLCSFLLQFQISNDCLTITAEPKILSYVLWATSLLGIATTFFILVCVSYFYLLNRRSHVREWGKKRKLSVLISLLLASFLSPPEVWSQLSLALAFLAISELFIWNFFMHNSLCAKRKKMA